MISFGSRRSFRRTVYSTGDLRPTETSVDRSFDGGRVRRTEANESEGLVSVPAYPIHPRASIRGTGSPSSSTHKVATSVREPLSPEGSDRPRVYIILTRFPHTVHGKGLSPFSPPRQSVLGLLRLEVPSLLPSRPRSWGSGSSVPGGPLYVSSSSVLRPDP